MVIGTTYGQISTYASAVAASTAVTGFTVPAGAGEAQLCILLARFMANPTQGGNCATLAALTSQVCR